MAKKNGTSLFMTVKKILWSPSKDSDKKIHQKETDYNKKKEKKGWIFRKTKLETTNSITDRIPTAEMEKEEKTAVTVSAVEEAVVEIRPHCEESFKGIKRDSEATSISERMLSSSSSTTSLSYYNIEARRNSMFAESNGFWDTKTYLQDIRSRRSLSKDMSRCSNEFVDNQEESQLILQKKLEIAIKREKAQVLALSNQIRSWNQSTGEETELLERTKWLNQWMATKQWDNTITTNYIQTKNPIDTTHHHHQRPYPATPPSCRATRSFGLRSASTRIQCSSPSSMLQPNYMSATESAKAKARTQSTPRRRPMTAKKRLCFAEEESLRSPISKSVYNGGCLWGDHESDYSCCYGDGFAGKISPCSTTDLRWLK
ncbi:hypothetical protein AALP_AA6G167700 [Arabis alpina]|uniref:DUF4005 domain-containing protein n=1 Tax=Arabis alpina TaxID=50452 RepID=A0A087GPQ7_ARAAL|nr:hypothetical protein AALP_AA6G167700 [Arabis alpina]